MVEIRTYSIDELVELTGVTPRNIAYYIKLGLLSKVGRKGRKTRYSQEFVDRLNFIEHVKALQDTGQVSAVTLPGIASVIWQLVDQTGEEPDFARMSDEEVARLLRSEEISQKRLLGETEDGQPVTARFGPLGPYVRVGEGKKDDPKAPIDAAKVYSITLDEALAEIKKKEEEKQKSLIKELDDGRIQILRGRWGPFVRYRGITVDVPKDRDPTQLTVADCERLIEARREKKAQKKASRRKEKLAARLDQSVRESAPMEYASALPDQSLSLDEPPRYLSESRRVPPRINKMVHAFSPELPKREPDRTLQDVERQVHQKQSGSEKRPETWTRAPITENIEISVKGIDPKKADLVDSLAQRIRELLGVE